MNNLKKMHRKLGDVKFEGEKNDEIDKVCREGVRTLSQEISLLERAGVIANTAFDTQAKEIDYQQKKLYENLDYFDDIKTIKDQEKRNRYEYERLRIRNKELVEKYTKSDNNNEWYKKKKDIEKEDK